MPASTGHILVVDDTRVHRMTLARILEQQGHTVALAETGMQALDMLRGASFDAVLLDIVMPGLDGFQVLERMKGDADLRSIPVIVISAVDEEESAVRCIEMGAEDYLPKPFKPLVLQARLRTSLEKKRLREMEVAYLQQEMMLRESEKLATLGRLSAGMMHELNNPAAATLRGASQLQAAVADLQRADLRLGALDLSERQRGLLAALDGEVRDHAAKPADMDPLMRGDREADVEAWLTDHDVDDAWELAPSLVRVGYDADDLAGLASDFTPDQLPAVIALLGSAYTVYSLLAEIVIGAGRISELVSSLKDYSHMDQAPVKAVDVHEGLENTMVMMRGELKDGVAVNREYADGLPRIQAYVSELNQVWTNVLDNAIDAMEGRGTITVRTRREGSSIVVEFEDTGAGIPLANQPKIFDPFFTTKPPGQGTGLGLNISHKIVVERHNGSIRVVSSRPGATIFEVKLPIDGTASPTSEAA